MEVCDLASRRRVGERRERPICLPSPISVLLATWMADGPGNAATDCIGGPHKKRGWMDGTRAKEESQKGEPIRRPRVDPSRRAVAFDIRFKMDLEGPFTQNEAKRGKIICKL